ncbi:MAG: DUF4115 domain-containing protein [Azoarcus sp.]|jgi:cytoskeleton protein RodZ|nr:DUF4115 domain-containing protein [Azoarcus sp.]
MQIESDSVDENKPEAEATPVPGFEDVSVPEFVPMEFAPPTLSAGEILKKAREERGESLTDIARTLKISAHQLEALENGRFDTLPGPTFVRGFLRNYARYLDIDPEPLLEGINVRTPTAADLSSMLKLHGNMQPAASPRPKSRALPVLLFVLGALALAGGLGFAIYKQWFNIRFDSPAKAPAPAAAAPKPAAAAPKPEKPEETVQLKKQVIKLEEPVPVNVAPELANLPALGESPVDASDPAAPAVPVVPKEATLKLLFNASTLAQVRDNSGRLIFTRTGSKGSASSVKGKPPFSVMVRQANNVKLEFNGQAVDLKGHTSRDGIARLTLQ